MLKYGGNGKLKQACVYRRCANPTETFQTPKTDSATPVQSQFKSESPRVKITFPATITSSPSIKTESTPIKIKTVYTAGPFNKASVTQSPPKKKKSNKYDEDPDFVIGDMEENDDDDVHETVLEEIEVRLITPPRTPSISRLKSQIMKPTFELKVGVKSGLEFFILKSY